MDGLSEQFDAHIRQQPLAVIAGAIAAGALVGLRATHRAHLRLGTRRHGRLAGLAITLAGALAMKVVREIALGQLGKLAQDRFGQARSSAHA